MARVDCRSAQREVQDLASDLDASAARVNAALKTIREKCAIAGMREVILWAEKATAGVREAHRMKTQGEARVKEARVSQDPKRAFDASLMAGKADRLYHEGKYQEAAELLKNAIETYRAIGQPIAAKDLSKQHARAECKGAIKLAHAADGTPDELLRWRAAASACSSLPDDRQYVARYLANAEQSSSNKGSGKKQDPTREKNCVSADKSSIRIACDTGSLTIVATNGCTSATRIRICIEKRDRTQDCATSPSLIPPRGTFQHHACQPTGRYSARAAK